jgi:hypothetical protein
MGVLMALAREHDLHRRRLGRNVGLGLTLVAFIVLVFGLTIAKVSGGGNIQAFDHSYRPALDPDVRPAIPGRGE